MNSQRNLNLSDEDLSTLLSQPADSDANAEVLALKSALHSYRSEMLDWADRRSATQPSLASKAKPNRWAAVPQWSLASVAIVAVAAGVVHFAGYGAEDIAPSSRIVTTSATTTQADDIAADNQLLGSIDQALRYTSVSPASEFNAKPVKQASRSTETGVLD